MVPGGAQRRGLGRGNTACEGLIGARPRRRCQASRRAQLAAYWTYSYVQAEAEYE